MYILYIPKYTLPAEIMVYIVMVRRFLFVKNQRGVTHRFWKTLIRGLCHSYSELIIYSFSSSLSFVRDNDLHLVHGLETVYFVF